jgi:hypothetical protein
MISKTSRYAAAPQASLVRADGTELHYVVPPILPHPDDHTRAQVHRVTDSDRPDTLAARAYGQATAWHMLANANTAAHPDQLTETPGAEIDIPMPEGMR